MAVKRLAILVSGRGSNFAAIADACARGELPATVVGVLSSRGDAEALRLAEKRQIPARVVEAKAFGDRDTYEAALIAEIARLRPDFVCLAGYMKLVGRALLERWPQRVLNIHPSLLPAFPGLRAQEQALAAGVRETGCTVHFVTEAMDAGPIVLQEHCPIEPGDDVPRLAARLLPIEHRTYVAALKALCTRGYRIEGGRVLWE